MSKERVQIWVDPNFRKALQKKKIDGDFSDMIDFTKEFAKELDKIPLKKRDKEDAFRYF